MEKLNELVEQAKEMAVLHGPVWSSALCESGCDGQAIKHHAIISDSKNDFVIDTGSDANEASWLCDYLELCSPANILAIAEAFRALEQQRDALAANEGYKQAFYEMAEILGIGARADSPKNVFEQLIKPMLINLKKNETPEGYVLVPQQMHLSADAMESLCFHCGDGGFAFGEFTEGMLWVGDIENDDGTKTYGLNIATAEYPEEGSANISEFAAQLRAGKDGE